jgi:hypothetical protein
MRIAFFADVDCNHGSKWIIELSARHEVILITHESVTDYRLYSKNKSITIYSILPKTYPLRDFILRKKIMRKISKIIKKHHIEIVHSMYAIPYSFWPQLINFKKHIITTRGSDMLVQYNTEYNNPKNIYTRIVYYFLKKNLHKSLSMAVSITSTSKSQINVIKSIIGDSNKLHLIRTGVNADLFIKNYNSTEEDVQEEFIIFSNRAMAALYNIEIIVQAFEIFKKNNEKIKCKLILLNYYGDAAYLNHIENIIQQKGLNLSVDILPDQNSIDLAKIYKKANLVVMIPLSDGTPVSAIETMLARRPLIIGNLHYDADLFNENTVWKLHSFDAKELCEKMEEIYQMNEAEKNTILNNAFNTAYELADMNKEIKKMELLYEQSIKK